MQRHLRILQARPVPHRPLLTHRFGAGTAAIVLAGSLLVSGSAAHAAAAAPRAPISTVEATTAVAETATTARKLSWAPPALTTPSTVTVSVGNRNLKLSAGKDYIVKMPSTPLVAINGLQIHGGRNVVLIGGEIQLPREAIEGTTHAGRGLYLKGQTGTVHIEGLRIGGPGLEDGINLDQRYGAKVQLQNVRVDTAHGSHSGAHADVLQTWAGPRQLLVDGLTGHTQYQGLFMLPTQQWPGGTAPELFDFRRMDLHGTSTSGYMMWRDNASWPLTVSDVWVAPKNPSYRDGFLMPKGSGAGTAAWPSVKVGAPPGGEFVPAGTAGVSYRSPGYRGTVDTHATKPAPAPTPAPAPVPAPAAPSSADHDRFRYGGAWSVSTARGEHYSNVAGRTASITATIGQGGGTVSLQGILGANKGIAAISIDGAPEVKANQYRSPGYTGTFFTTPRLPAGQHTITVRVTGHRAPGGTGSYVALTGATTTNGTLNS